MVKDRSRYHQTQVCGHEAVRLATSANKRATQPYRLLGAGIALLSVALSVACGGGVDSSSGGNGGSNGSGTGAGNGPSISTVSPSQITLFASENPVVTVYGANFTSQSVVLINSKEVPTSFESSTALQAVPPNGQASAPGTYSVTVQDPDIALEHPQQIAFRDSQCFAHVSQIELSRCLLFLHGPEHKSNADIQVSDRGAGRVALSNNIRSR
jgi:hypothetical protein